MDYHQFLHKKRISFDVNQSIVCEHTTFVCENGLKSRCNHVRQIHELRNRQLFGSTGHDWSLEKAFGRRVIRIENLSQRDTEHLPTLVEGGLDHATEELFVAAKVSDGIACHTDDGTLYLGRRVENRGLDRKEIFHIIPRLNQYRQDAVLLIARLRGHTNRHLVLDHTRTTRNQILVVEHLEENLRGDVVGVVACEHELLPVEDLMQIHAEEVATYYIIIKAGEVLSEISHTLTVDLNDLERTRLFREILRHHTHTRAYLEDGQLRIGLIHRVSDPLGDAQIGQKMLTKILFRSYLLHFAAKVINKNEKMAFFHF